MAKKLQPAMAKKLQPSMAEKLLPAMAKKLTSAMAKKLTSPALHAVSKVLLLMLVLMANEAAAQLAFCRSQFNLANEACSLRTFPGVNPATPRRLLNESSAGGYELQAARGHAGGGHGRHHHGGADPYDTACCRRLTGIDNSCICQAMSYLPVFMSRVKHSIKLTPVPGCDISFECAAVY